MGLFIAGLIGCTFAVFVLVLALGGLLGEAGLYISMFVVCGFVLSLLVCVLVKLGDLERKLDKLLALPEQEQARREAAHRETARVEQLLSEQEAPSGGGEGPA